MKNKRKKIILLGAGGREFHNFNICFRNNPNYEVVGFTATQIPYIENRIYPPQLSGPLYKNGIPISSEKKLSELIKKYKVEEVIFSYSDISHLDLMHIASKVLACGADFKLLGPESTQLKSKVPVIAVCAVRTGCGKSQISAKFAKILRAEGKKVVIIRHPMPYSNLEKQISQRFRNLEDLDKNFCTIEEREEYEPLIKEGFTVLAGVDYQRILTKAEKTAEVIIWDGGNNDFPFLKPNLHIVICDPLRPGHEILYHPGETNLRMADVVIINKVNSARKEDINFVYQNIKLVNPRAKVIMAESRISVDQPELIKGKTVLVVEDGPTVTHGEMPFGAGLVAAQNFQAREIVEPLIWAKGEIKKALKKYPHLQKVLPAIGYSPKQIKDLKASINAVHCDAVVSATPIDLSEIIEINKPLARVTYESQKIDRILTKILKESKII